MQPHPLPLSQNAIDKRRSDFIRMIGELSPSGKIKALFVVVLIYAVEIVKRLTPLQKAALIVLSMIVGGAIVYQSISAHLFDLGQTIDIMVVMAVMFALGVLVSEIRRM